MKVETSHHIDASEPDADGMHEWHYEYELYRFSDGGVSLVARSYVEEPEQAHFINADVGGAARLITKRELTQPLFVEALAYLRRAGKTRIELLGVEGYTSIP
ncbi:MAG: hypothetical protein ACREVL_15485 [Solimonas sp.]